MTGEQASLRPLELRLTPEEALSRWPRGEGLAVLWSGGDSEHARWVVLARPSGCQTGEPGDVSGAKAFLERVLGDFAGAGGSRSLHSDEDVAMAPGKHMEPGADLPPFRGGVIFALSYDLGRVLEPAVGRSRYPSVARVLAFPCGDALIYDRVAGRWWGVGSPPELEAVAVEEAFERGEVRPVSGPEGYTDAVERILEYIRAGDVYQVNLAHRLTGAFEGSTRAFFGALMGTARPWYGAYLEGPGVTIASASPELFLSYEPLTRRLATRPMKGTRPAAMEGELAESAKDAAELNMITDLMRNDIGKVSELGSVRVEQARSFERHNQLVQTTSTVTGTLREGLTFVDALLSAFPGGSVTGCPKIRAMQIIDELEAGPRGFYCGAIGYVSASGHAAFNIAIRTAVIEKGTLTYHAGAGIVIDSDPAAEWQETLDKAGILGRVASGVTA